MKQLISVALLLLATLNIWAQGSFSLKQDEGAVVYSLPKTEFVIEITTEKKTETPGQFYKYSERYLATNKVVLQEKTTCKLVSIKLVPRAIADPKRTYTFVPDKSTAGIKLAVNEQGVLTGVNVKQVPPILPAHKPMLKLTESNKSADLLPLGEEYMMAGSEAKMAEGAAKQIYRIRESRLSLLTADVEKMPADGASLKAMLDGLNKMEKELTELFVGKTTISTETNTIYFCPEQETTDYVLFRVSPLRGLVSAEDMSGTPYYITIKPEVISTTPADPKAKPAKVLLQSVLPALTKVSITDGVNALFHHNYFIPQFGKTIPVPNDLLNPQSSIYFDAQTGRILRVQ